MVNLVHGGDLSAAEKTFGIKQKDWLDLSTGINPKPWPVPAIPTDIWQRLPTLEQPLINAAKVYYRCRSILAVPGSQFAIQTLPKLFKAGTVAIPLIGYQEHRRSWEKAGHTLTDYTDDRLDELEKKISSGEVHNVVVINPNNPSCTIIEKKRLELWLKQLSERNGFLIIDETFIDTHAESSIAENLESGNLIILRSVGKFFGLAGIRLGFVLASVKVCHRVQQHLGPWAVSGPAQWIGIQALSDIEWQKNNCLWLETASEQLRSYLEDKIAHKIITINNTPLFITLHLDTQFATSLYNYFGSQGILLRVIPLDKEYTYIRIGLLSNDEQWEKFKITMNTFLDTNKA